MCCHDWGAKHPIGYIDENGFGDEDSLNKVKKGIENNNKGFELLKNAKMPQEYNKPEKIQNLIDIWRSEELNKVRRMHKDKKIDELKFVKNAHLKRLTTGRVLTRIKFIAEVASTI